MLVELLSGHWKEILSGVAAFLGFSFLYLKGRSDGKAKSELNHEKMINDTNKIILKEIEKNEKLKDEVSGLVDNLPNDFTS